MKVRRFATPLQYSMIGMLLVVGLAPARALAQGDDARMLASQHHDHGPGGKASTLVKIVREATERFKDPSVAEEEGYGLQFGCVSGPDAGAMGMHFVNFPLALDAVLDATRPEIVIYEPLPNGRLRLVGADFLVLKKVWHDAGNVAPPQLHGQLFHLFEAPNRFGLDDFYTLHVWAWKESPTGTFVNWHPKVSCDAFSGQP